MIRRPIALIAAMSVGGAALYIWVASTSNINRTNAAETTLCDQLAEDVATGALPLDRYMETRCPADLIE